MKCDVIPGITYSKNNRCNSALNVKPYKYIEEPFEGDVFAIYAIKAFYDDSFNTIVKEITVKEYDKYMKVNILR